MKSIYYTIILLMVSAGVFPQRKQTVQIVDSARLLCIYKQEVVIYNPETKTKTVEGYTTALQMGHHISGYYDYNNMFMDSIYWKHYKEGLSMEESVNKSMPYVKAGRMKERLYKNLPNSKITSKNAVGGESYTYEEPYDKPTWTLLKETKIILGYPCRKATTNFRGRKYEAWYATDIPISDGPWKFCGLPGLILSIRDDKGEVSFVCQSVIRPKPEQPIFKSIDGSMTVRLKDKQAFNEIYKKYMENPAAFVMGSGLVSGMKPHPNSYKKRYYNPIELSE